MRRPIGIPLRQRAVADRLLLLARRSVYEFRDDHCPQLAAAISYHLLFALFPLAITAVGIVGLVTQSPHARDAVVNDVLKLVPLSANGSAQLRHLVDSVGGSAGALGLIGMVGVLWSASGVMAALRTALNLAWDTDEHRRFLRGKAVDLLLIGCAVVFVGAALALTVLTSLAEQGAHQLPGPLDVLDSLAGAAVSVGAFFGATALLFATFLFLYRVVPACPTRVPQIWPGALVAALGFELAQFAFSVYVAHFHHYNKIYGSLGAVVAFLFFVYLASSVLLFGAEVASEFPRLPPRPSGTASATEVAPQAEQG